MFVDSSPVLHKTYVANNRTNEWENFSSYFDFVDHVGCWDTPIDPMRQIISYYDSAEVSLNDECKAALSPRGIGYNTTNVSLWDYQLLQNNPVATNTNCVGFRMVHDGTYIKLYLNPDPYDRNPALPNEWLFLAQKQVVWNDAIQIMVGHGQRCSDSVAGMPQQDADFDNLLIKSSVDVSKQIVSPPSLPTSTTLTDYKKVTLMFSNVILKQTDISNAGINYIKITKPNEFRWPYNVMLTNNTTNYCVRVRDFYEGNVTQRTLYNNQFNTDMTSFFGSANKAMIRTNGNDLYIILSSQITNMPVDSYEHIYVDMRFKVTNFSSVQFDSWVQAELFEGMPVAKKSNYSTCSWQKTTGTASIGLSEGSAYAYASISPNQIFQGPNDYSFTYKFSTTGVVGRQDITWAAIKVPDGFSNTQITNFDSDRMGTNERTLIKVTNITALGPGKFIRLNYTTSTLASPGGLDVITFNIKGSVNKGNWKWQSWVDGNSLSGSSLATGTNLNYNSQWVRISGETPKVDGEITQPSSGDPRVLFNSITKSTLEYKLRNTSANIDNKIYDAIITVPGIFTNVKKFSSVRISTNYVKIGKINNISYVTLHYGQGGNPITYNNGDDRVKFITYHNISAGKTTNVTFSAVVNNSNGEGFKDVQTTGLVNTIRVTDPQPIASCSIQPVDGVVYTSEVSNVFKYRIKNTAPAGLINFARVILPVGYFTNITWATSSLITDAGISIGRSNIFFNYNSQGKSLAIGEYDDVYFRVSDKYTNTTPGSITVRCFVSNLANRNEANDLNPPDETRTVNFVPQEARVQSWLSNYYVLAEVTSSTLYYIFNNYGDEGNKVSYAEGTFVGSGGGGNITAITKATSVNSGEWSISGLRFSKTGYSLAAGQRDVVKLILTDDITSDTYRDIVPLVTVNTSVLRPTTKPAGTTNRVFFQTPPPDADGKILPNIMFTSAVKRTNNFGYTVYNDGNGSNELEEVIILLPAILQGKVRITGTVWSGTVFSNLASRVVVNYRANTLDAKATDTISLVVTNSILQATNLYFKMNVANNDQKGRYTNTGVIAGGRKFVYVIPRPDAYISSPAYIEDSSVTNLFTYKLNNTNTSAQKIMKTRISIPSTVYTMLTNTVLSPWLGSVEKVSNGYIYIDYSANYLSGGVEDTITFQAKDNINKTTNTSYWTCEVQYLTNGLYYPTGTALGNQYMKIQMAPAVGNAALSRNYIYTTSVTNLINLYLTNRGTGQNNITKARVFFSGVGINAGDVSTTRISNDGGNITYAAGVFNILYKDDNHVLNAGMNDVITIKMWDQITNITSVTLRVEVNNTDPVQEIYTSASGNTKIDSVFPLNVYISPDTMDMTTYTNVYIYRINNIGGNRPIQRAVITFPGIISGVMSNSSLWLNNDGANIRLSGSSSMTLRYSLDPSGALGATGYDMIGIKASDNRDIPETNVQFNCYIDDGSGYVEAISTIGQSRNITYEMPDVSGKGQLRTGSIDISRTNAVRTVSYYITNTGNYANRIYYAELKYPTLFSNCIFSNITSGILGTANLTNYKNGTNRAIRIYYENGTKLGSRTSDVITVTLKNFSISNEIFGLPFGLQVRNQPQPASLKEVDDGTKLNISDPNPYRADAYLVEGSQVIYTLNKSANLTYRIDNNSIKSNINRAVIRFDGSIFSNLKVTSRLCATNDIIRSVTNIVINYPAGSFTKVGGGPNYYDIIGLEFDYSISIPTSRTLGCEVTYQGGVQINPGSGIETQILAVEKAYWGRIEGMLRPNDDITINLYKTGSSTRAVNFNSQATFYSVKTATNYATFVLDMIPEGSYDVELQLADYKTARYKVDVRVSSNAVTDIGTVVMKNSLLEAKSAIVRTVRSMDDSETYIQFPVGSVLDDFYLNIYKQSMTTSQVNSISKTDSIIAGQDNAGIKVYELDLEDSGEAKIDEIEIGNSVTVVLHYTDDELALQGWSEDTLAIYYYKENTGQWIKLGGKVDKDRNTVTVKVNYLHNTYAIFGSKAAKYVKVFGDLKCWPNPFSPGRGGDMYGNLKISFLFKETVKKFAFNVYDLSGRKVYTKEYQGEYSQGEIYWDGKDKDKYAVKSGVYIYQIDTGSEYYRGKVLILK
ncbi:MAG: hypothetical protein PHF84_05090 [bacterium]|nr:hypothetical protein [bacterium]